MQVYIHIFLVVIRIYENICTISVPAPLCLAGPADTRMHDRPARPTAFRWNQKYPRVCREKSRSWRTRRSVRGSPPHMRGKAGNLGKEADVVRITPAYAGKRCCAPLSVYRYKDHPRVCGEKKEFPELSGLKLGSPPRMRGKEVQHGIMLVAGGITPAYAGKSPLRFAPGMK